MERTKGQRFAGEPALRPERAEKTAEAQAPGCGLTLPALGAGVEVRHGKAWTMVHVDCTKMLHRIGRFDAMITDPPYSDKVHAGVGAEHRADGRAQRSALRFASLDRATCRAVAAAAGYLGNGWAIFFGDEYTMPMWRTEGERNRLEWATQGFWRKPNALPRMSGDGPAPGGELFAVMHSGKAPGEGRREWNSGGSSAFYSIPQDGTYAKSRDLVKLHDTPKPLPLCSAIIADYTVRGEVVVDPFAGSAVIGEACIMQGRRYLGIELARGEFANAVERLIAADAFVGVTNARRRGQPSLFEVVT